MIDTVEQTESEKARAIFSHLCHDAGLLGYQIYRLSGDLADLQVKIRNAEIDYKKAKEAETTTVPHIKEATEPTGVTQ